MGWYKITNLLEFSSIYISHKYLLVKLIRLFWSLRARNITERIEVYRSKCTIHWASYISASSPFWKKFLSALKMKNENVSVREIYIYGYCHGQKIKFHWNVNYGQFRLQEIEAKKTVRGKKKTRFKSYCLHI